MGAAVYVPSEIEDIQNLANSLWRSHPALYIPLIKTASQLESASNVAIHANGGFISTSPGTAAEGTLNLRQEIDFRGVGRAEFIVDWQRDAGREIIVGIGDFHGFMVTLTCFNRISSITKGAVTTITTEYQHGLDTGVEVTISGATGVTAINGTWVVTRTGASTFTIALDTSADGGTYDAVSGRTDTAVIGGLGATFGAFIPAGATLCVGITWANSIVTQSMQLMGGAASLGANNPLRGCPSVIVATSQINFSEVATSYANRLRLRTTGINSRIVGVHCRIGSLEGPPDARLPTRNLLHQVTPDNQSTILLPAKPAKSPVDLVCYHHQNLGHDRTLKNHLSGDAGASWTALAEAGYCIVASSGVQTDVGSNADNPANFDQNNFGNGSSLLKTRDVIEFVRHYLPNTRNLYHLGCSMGLVNALGYHMMFPGQSKAIFGVCGVTDLNESGMRGSPANLANAIDTAFGAYYVSIQGSNTNHAPASSPTWWRPISYRGALAPEGDRLPNLTAVTTGASSATQTLDSTSGLYHGQRIYFHILRQWRRILSITGSDVVLDRSISTTTGELVRVSYGLERGVGESTQWTTRALYNSGTTYAMGDIVLVKSAASGADNYSSNPLRSPERFVDLPIHLRYGTSGGTNDGTINTVQATAFESAVNALGGQVTTQAINAAHLAAATFDGAGMVAFFRGHQ